MNVDTMTWEEAVKWLRSQPGQVEMVRACFYDDPLTDAAERYFNSTEWAAVRRLLPTSRGRALDVGAGRGIAAYALARDGWRTTAVEPNPSPLVGTAAIRSLMDSSGVSVEVIQHAGERLPVADQSCELVHCRAVLHHAQDMPQFCREVARVLVPGGLFVATREHVISRQEDLPQFLAAHPLHRLYGGENAHLLDEYRGAISAAGLRVRRTLNPYESDINLFPDSIVGMKRRIARRLHLPVSAFIPDALLTWLGSRLDQPGRLYTFVAQKP